jgi:hypothetical protein
LDEGPINVLLGDDDEGFLTSLRELVDRQPELHVVAVARNGIEAIEYADEHMLIDRLTRSAPFADEPPVEAFP